MRPPDDGPAETILPQIRTGPAAEAGDGRPDPSRTSTPAIMSGSAQAALLLTHANR